MTDSTRPLGRRAAFAAALAMALWAAAPARAGQYLLENFTQAAPTSVHGPVVLRSHQAKPKFGLGCLAIEYDLSDAGRADITFDVRGPGPGTVKFWVKGDGSGNTLGVSWAIFTPDKNGRPRDRRGFGANVVLDFTDWRQFTTRSPNVPGANLRLRLTSLRILRGPKAKTRRGTVLLDEMTVEQTPKAFPGSVLLATTRRLASPAERVRLYLDVRNDSDNSASCALQARLTDSKGNHISEIRRQWDAPAHSAKEVELAFAAALEGYVPPLAVHCNFVSAALGQEIAIARKAPMTTAREVVEDFSQVTDLWRGGENTLGEYLRQNTQPVLWHDEGTRLRRLTDKHPFGPYALEWQYTLVRGRDDIFWAQFLSGDPVRMSVWVWGDGSGNRLKATTREWNPPAFGHDKTRGYQHDVCTLSFTGWRQFTFDLPAKRLGSIDPIGAHRKIDYPYELIGFHLATRGAGAPTKGTIRLGAITLDNQGPGSKAIGVRIADKLDDGLYRPGAAAVNVLAYNYHTSRPRKARLTTRLRDRDGKDLFTRSLNVSLAPTTHQATSLDLPAVKPGAGPLMLLVNLRDIEDPQAVASAAKVLSLPNAVKTWRFDTRRTYTTHFADIVAAPADVLADVAKEVAGPVVEASAGRKAVPLAWARRKNQPVAVSAIMIDPALPGLPTRISVDVFGDGSGVRLYPIFAGKGGEPKDSFVNRMITLTDVRRIDFRGWRRLTFRAPVVHPYWRDDHFRRHRPIYPLNLFLVAAADAETTPAAGKLLLDDLQVQTQLPPARGLRISPIFKDRSDFLSPGDPVAVAVENWSLSPRKVEVRVRLEAPDGTPLARVARTLSLQPGADAHVDVLPKGLPRGAYRLVADAKDGAGGRAMLDRAMVVMRPTDLGPEASWPKSFLATQTADWPEIVIRADTLRTAAREFREPIKIDWDLLEPYPGTFQLDGLKERLQAVRGGGGESFVMLGFSADWAAGEGLDKRRRGVYARNQRDWGHVSDYWHVPERIEDWDNYVYRLARDVGAKVNVWAFWDNPDVPGAIHLPPEKAFGMLQSVRKWTRRYSPKSKVLLAGLNVGTAVGYLQKLHALGAGDLLDAVNVKVDPGAGPPEVWGLREYLLGVRLAAPGKDILISEMDWAVRPPRADGAAFGALDQGQYVGRMCLLAHWTGADQPLVRLRNSDDLATGTGLTYRLSAGMSGKKIASESLVPRPAYLALMTLRPRLAQLEPHAQVEMDDLRPGNTHVLIYAAGQGSAAAMWRVEGTATIALPKTVAPGEAINLYGTPLTPAPAAGGKVAISRTPILIAFPRQSPRALRAALLSATLAPAADEAGEKAMTLQDRVLPSLTPSARAHAYKAAGSLKPVARKAILPGAGIAEVTGLSGIRRESFTLAGPADADMVLKRRFDLAGKGNRAHVTVNGKPAGVWDLTHSRPKLHAGLRDAHFIVPGKLLAKDGRQKVELRYEGDPATTFAVWSLRLNSPAVPLGQLAPLYSAQAVGRMRLDRNVVGDGLTLGTQRYRRGIGVHAWSVLEYPLNKQFRSFTAVIGVDSCSQGRGSVRFEVRGDGKALPATIADLNGGKKRPLLGKTQILTGLSAPRRIVVDVSGVDRLTLVVHNADDGSRADAADWCRPVLQR